MSTLNLKPITLPGEALGWISTVLAAAEEEVHDTLKWLPMKDTTDAEIKERVTDLGFYDEVEGHSQMVELLICMRDLDVALAACHWPELPALPALEAAGD